MSTLRCGTACAPSRKTGTWRSRANRTISFTGTIGPRAPCAGDKLGLLAEKTPILIKNYLAVMVDWNHTKPGTDLFTKHLPWNNIGVMFHRGDNNLISS